LSVERQAVQVLSTEKRTSVLHSTDVKLGRVTTTVTTTTTRTRSTSNMQRPHIRCKSNNVKRDDHQEVSPRLKNGGKLNFQFMPQAAASKEILSREAV